MILGIVVVLVKLALARKDRDGAFSDTPRAAKYISS